MKILNLLKNNIAKFSILFGLSSFSLSAFADDASWNNLGDFYSDVILTQGGVIFKITIAIATIAGIILIVKGLVHLKQNYTGTGQEKHLSKGIASLGFGTALILAIPLSHALVGAAGSQTTFNTGTDNNIDFGGTTPTPPPSN